MPLPLKMILPFKILPLGHEDHCLEENGESGRWNVEGFSFIFSFSDCSDCSLTFSEPPAPQSARPSHHWVDGCSDPHITEQPQPFSESRSFLKSGGWARETGTQPNQSFQEPRLCATYVRSEPADEMHCYSVRNATASETSKAKAEPGQTKKWFLSNKWMVAKSHKEQANLRVLPG